MSTKENNLKEKFKIALTSTAKVIADDFDTKKTIKLIKHWFSDVPAGNDPPKISHPKPFLSNDKRVYFEDKVNLPLIHISWLTPPFFNDGAVSYTHLTLPTKA